MVKYLEALLVLIVYLASTSEGKPGSCWRYGHSCWGGHGKRAGAPPIILPSHATTSATPMEQNGRAWNRDFGKRESDNSAIQYRSNYNPIPLPISGASLGYNYYAGMEGDDDDDIVTMRSEKREPQKHHDFFTYLLQTSDEIKPPSFVGSIQRSSSDIINRLRMGGGLPKPKVEGASRKDYNRLLRLGLQLQPEEEREIERLPIASIAIDEDVEQNSNETPSATSSISSSSPHRNNWSLYRQRLLRHGK